jgi:hypothetical protein
MFVDEDAQKELDAEQQLGHLRAPAGSLQGEATSVN